MATNYVQPGHIREILAGADIASGGVTVLRSGASGEIGVAVAAISNGSRGSVMVSGVHALPKASGAITANALVYWSSGNSNITTTASGNTLAGVAVASATTSATTVNVLINGRPGPDLSVGA